jgi:hypothetical protein
MCSFYPPSPHKFIRFKIIEQVKYAGLLIVFWTIQAFVHFSTAYSNCTMKEIGERFYTPPLRWTDLTQLIDSLDERTIEMITPMYVPKKAIL